MNAPCKQLRSMKGPQCAWSIRRDVGQGLRMLETFPCSCYGALLARGRSSSHLRHIYLCLWLTFVHRVLTSSRSEDLIDMSVECCKRLHFRQITLFVVFFSFILAPDTWPWYQNLVEMTKFPWAVTSCLLKLLRKGAARRTATWSQMNAPCKQLRSMKGPQCAWSIRRDVGQGLRMLETFPCSCYGLPLARAQVLESTRACLFMFVANFCAISLGIAGKTWWGSEEVPSGLYHLGYWNF